MEVRCFRARVGRLKVCCDRLGLRGEWDAWDVEGTAMPDGELRAEFVPREATRAVWDWVRPRLEHVLKRTGEPWLPEDIYLALKNGIAGLYVVVNGNRLFGFFVAEVVTDLDASRHFSIWIAYGDMKPIVKEAVPMAEKIGSSFGCKTLRFRSPRRGWEKAYPGLFEVREVVYQRNIGGSQ